MDNNLCIGAYGEVPVRLTAKPPTLIRWLINFRISAMQSTLLVLVRAARLGEGRVRDNYRRGARNSTNIAYPQFMLGEPVASNSDLLTRSWVINGGEISWLRTFITTWLKEGGAEYSNTLLKNGRTGTKRWSIL